MVGIFENYLKEKYMSIKKSLTLYFIASAFLVNAIGWRNTLFSFVIIGVVIAFVVFNFLRYEKAPASVLKNNSANVPINFTAILRNRQTHGTSHFMLAVGTNVCVYVIVGRAIFKSS